MLTKKLRRFVAVLLVLILFSFIARLVLREWDRISRYSWHPDPAWLTASILVLFTVYILAGCGWKLILKMMHVELSWKKGISITLLSMFGKYIPGGIWTTLGRMYLSRIERIPDSRSGVSIILEQAYILVSAGVVFAASCLFWGEGQPLIRFLPAVILISVFVLFLHPTLFLKIINPVLSRLGKNTVHISLSYRQMLILGVYYIFYWVVTGFAFYCFVRSFYPMDFSYVAVLTGIFAISFASGYLFLFVPAGLGIREGTLTLLLGLFLPVHVAVGMALLSRVWVVGVELLIMILLLINGKTRRMMRTALGG